MVVRQIRREVSKNQIVALLSKNQMNETLNNFKLLLGLCFRKIIVVPLATTYWRQVTLERENSAKGLFQLFK